jgi:choline-glycine betaine transporter
MEKGFCSVKVIFAVIVREKRVMEPQIIDLFASFGLIIGVAYLPFICFTLITFELKMLELIGQNHEAKTWTCVCRQGPFIAHWEVPQHFGFDVIPLLRNLNATVGSSY